MVKKAQMKIQQMALMLMVVTLFFIFVGLFVMMFRFAGLKESAESLEEKNALLLVNKLANSPEFSCGYSFGSNKINCIDADKVMILKDKMEAYSGFWGGGIKNIIIWKLPLEETKECTKTNFPNCNTISLFSEEFSGFPRENFVSLCHKEAGEDPYNKCEIAKLTIYYNE